MTVASSDIHASYTTSHSFMTNCLVIFLVLRAVCAFPCPSECICKPIDMIDVDFKRMVYTMDCSHISLNDNQLIYHAEPWSFKDDTLVDDDDDDDDELKNEYVVAIDLTNSSSLKHFHHQTIRLTGFPIIVRSLSLACQSNKFILQSNAFNSSLYTNLQTLNLSSCCQQIPIECQQLFVPLTNLRVLDLSGSDMYKTCLDKPGRSNIDAHLSIDDIVR
jgi:hypothetical protein